jgi:hypothetical protein
MGITCTFATPYNPQAKGWIERFFGTVEGQFGKTFQTYCGNKPENRPESTDKILADVKKGNDPAGIPSIDHVRHEFGRWVEEVYHVTPHTGAGMDNTPPIAFMRENLDSKRVAEEHVLDLMLMSWSKPVKVGKHGVVFNRINYGMQSVELFAVQGQEVRVAYDPNDVSEVAVFDLQGRYLCKAKASGIVTGMTDEDIRQGIAYKRHITKAIKQSDNVRHLAHRDVTELARIAAAQAARDQAGEIPERADISVIEPIHSDLEAALLNKLRPFKKAVGDEGSSPKLSDFLTDETSRSGSDDDAIDILKLHLTDEKDAK